MQATDGHGRGAPDEVSHRRGRRPFRDYFCTLACLISVIPLKKDEKKVARY